MALNHTASSWKLPPVELIFGKSPLMALAKEKLGRVASTNIPVLIQGESGTGKDVIATLLHLRSGRNKSAWVKITCPAIPHSLIESELFGYEKGAFTGANTSKRGRIELAHGGTLFLDEVGSLDMSVQSKLLQVLQDGTFMRVGAQEPRHVDTRLICAANGDLRQQTADGTFRMDVLFRINAVTIDLPPLRERVADIPILIDYFLETYAQAFGANPKPLSRDLKAAMSRYHWPGNIRELENIVRSYVLIGNEDIIAGDLIPAGQSNQEPEIDLDRPVSLKQITRTARLNMERSIILKVLRANGWSRQKTAKWLKISYRSLLYKLQELEIVTFPSQACAGPAQPIRNQLSEKVQ